MVDCSYGVLIAGVGHRLFWCCAHGCGELRTDGPSRCVERAPKETLGARVQPVQRFYTQVPLRRKGPAGGEGVLRAGHG